MRVLLPGTVDEACTMLAERPGAIPVAGGTDLMVHWPQRVDDHDRDYLDLSSLGELRAMELTEDALVLGAAATYWDVITDAAVSDAFPLLPAAAREIGAVQIQTRGTWGGNVMNASPAADGVAVLMAYDAVLRLQSVAGAEDIPLAEFYLDYKRMRCAPGQIVREIRLPRRRHTVEAFEKVVGRRAQAITKVGVAVARSGAGWRVVANSVAPTVCRCATLERMLEDERPVASPDDLLAAIDRDVSPIDDLRSTAAYRRIVLGRVLYHMLRGRCPSFT